MTYFDKLIRIQEPSNKLFLSIAGWKLNDDHNIFSVSLFDSGHKMLYGYELEESYTFENWMVDELNEKYMQIRVDKIFEGQSYTFILRFEVIR